MLHTKFRGGSTLNLALIGKALSEKMFEIVDDDVWTDARVWVS